MTHAHFAVTVNHKTSDRTPPANMKFCALVSLLLVCGVGSPAPSAMARSSNPVAQARKPPSQPGGQSAQERLTIGEAGSVPYALPWRTSEMKYSNAHELIRLPQAPAATTPQEEKTKPPSGPLARILITNEKRKGAEEAVKRLQEMARSRPGSVRFYGISGWPAVEIQFTQRLPRRGDEEQEYDTPAPIIQRAIVAVAVDADLITFDISLGPETAKDVLQEALQIAGAFVTTKQNDREKLRRTLEQLQDAYQKKVPPEGAHENKRPADLGSLEESAGAAQIQNGGNGELEIATSPDASKIVIASNSGLQHSSDHGEKFQAGNAVFGMNDPTLSRGDSGNFYLGQIAFPTGLASQKNVAGCTNAVSRSSDNGANFNLRGFSAVCPTGSLISNSIVTLYCFPDQPHIAADSFSEGSDQVYAVWRQMASLNIGSGPGSCSALSSGSITPSISCSSDGGSNWTAPAAISGIDDFPRVAVGKDGKVYVVGLSGNNVMLNRFTSCRDGLVEEQGFPVTVTNLSDQVQCPVPGLDRCNDGNTLSSPTVAPDPDNAAHLSVSFAESDGSGGERVVSMESTDSGATFPQQFTLSPPTSARRFLPWACSTAGEVFVGWYDRGAATAAHNALTDYVVGSTILATPKNLSKNPDGQCELWPCAPRNQNDSTSCSVQPQLAGVCLNGSGSGSRKKCDFNIGACPSGESCQTGGGCPKYGDYNGIACAGEFVVAAWASATAPKGLPRPASRGISIFSQTFSIKKTGPPTFDRVQIILTTGNDNAGSGLELVATLSGQKRPICLKPSTSLPPDGICANGNGATDQNGRNSWDNWSGSDQTFALDTPKDSTDDFKTITITSLQSSCGLSCDNWDLQSVAVVVSDSAKKLKPVTLLSMGNGRNPNNSDNCMARLKAPPHVNSVTYNLNAKDPAGSNKDNRVFGPSPPGSCPQ